MKLLARILEKLWMLLPDRCQICRGRNGGVRGNENVIDGVVMCDYCSVAVSRAKRVIG